MVQRFDVGPRLSEMTVHNGVCYLAGQAPSRATVVARLAKPEWRVEMVVTAAL